MSAIASSTVSTVPSATAFLSSSTVTPAAKQLLARRVSRVLRRRRLLLLLAEVVRVLPALEAGVAVAFLLGMAFLAKCHRELLLRREDEFVATGDPEIGEGDEIDDQDAV